MGPFEILKQFLLFFSLLLNLVSSDHTDFVYKGCANQFFQDPNGIYSQSLSNLFDSLTAQSSSSKFYNTTSGQGLAAINGLFQCRGDLSNSDCHNCVKIIPKMSDKLCGKTIAVRIQLEGCYLRYEIAGFRQVGATELLFKICGSDQVSGSGFGDRLGAATGEIAKGVVGGNGFYLGEYQSVYVLGQCEGDLGNGDCVNCVKNASQSVKSVCGESISAQIYLQMCYISYSYYPNGIPSKSVSSSSSGTSLNAQKLVAIVLGGIVGVGLVAACLLFTRSAYKKQRHAKHGVQVGIDPIVLHLFRVASKQLYFFHIWPTVHFITDSSQMASLSQKKYQHNLRYALQVRDNTGPWTVIVQVLVKYPTKASLTKTNQLYKKFLLTDMKGTAISAITFTAIDHFDRIFEPFKRYYVTSASVNVADPRYKVGEHMDVLPKNACPAD